MDAQGRKENRFTKDIQRIQDKNPFISNTDLVYTILQRQIIEHTIAPGTKLNQEEIATEMNVSRTPVRDALGRLAEEGYVVRDGQSCSVYEMTANDYALLLDVRIALETLAVRLACSRILTSERRKIRDNLDRADKLLAEGRKKACDEDFNVLNRKESDRLLKLFSEIDYEFHELIVEASHNPYLIEEYRHMMPKIHFFRYSALTVHSCLNMVERHRQVFQAVLDRNEPMAESCLHRHLELTVPQMLGTIH